MCALVTDDETDAISRYNLDDDDPDGSLPQRSYWWSLHRPETYALTGFALAFGTLLSYGPAQELVQSIAFSIQSQSEHTVLYIASGVRLGIALLAILAAVISIRSEDDDTTWTPPVARATLLVAAFSALVSIAALIATAVGSDPSQNPNF